jgi:FAD/FMN-containing dehydrogenase/Fe-S oxidoreductase
MTTTSEKTPSGSVVITQIGVPGSAPVPVLNVDAEGLAAELRSKIRGEVRFDKGSRALYATDASNYRQAPIGVVVPRDKEDVIETMAACRRYGAPVLSRGGGTSLAGQCCNVAVVMDMSQYMRDVLEIDPQAKRGRVLPGCVLDDLRSAAERHHLTFGPDPATHSRNTLGGMLGNNSCGVHAVLAAKEGTGARTSDNTHEMEILTYDGLRMRVGATSDTELQEIIRAGGRRGEIYAQLKALRDKYADQIRKRFPRLPRRVSGYNLDELLPENGFNVARALVGTEGTCVAILEATLCLVASPPFRSLVILGYPDVYCAADHVTQILQHGPTALEGFDRLLFDWVKRAGTHPHGIELMPPGGGWLLVEFGGDNQQAADVHARQCMEALKKAEHPPSMKLFDNKAEEKEIWEIRESGLGSTAWVPGHPDNWPGWEDSAVPPDVLGGYLRDLRKLMSKYGYHASLYGHFGQGCIHCRIGFDLVTANGIRSFHSFVEEAADLVVSYGGSLSGEHGDGQSRAELLPKMFGDEIVQAFREFKAIWDPEWKMNPGKVVDPYPITSNLRLGADYNPREPRTHFKFPADQHTFSRATLRCVGAAKCRQEGGGTMCPSYMVTHEEKHSTRGRARLLFEMLQGKELDDGWKSEAVKDALHLCLSCKGCKGDCPVQVDMATYKAEFLSHYYEGRVRPRQAYVFGLIHWWASLASRMPGLVNFVTQAPVLRDLAKAAAGMAPERTIPAFAPQTFRDWFNQRGALNAGKAQVMLWPDTFNNHFHPEVAQAAVEVLEAAGYQVTIPEKDLCCGRPLYDYGMLDLAERWLLDVLDALRPAIESGVCVVGLEPSCVAVFRDELTNLFPHNQDAIRLSRQSYMLSEFLEKIDYQPPKLHRKAVVHGHCHHKSLLKFGAEEAVLNKLGLEYQVLDSGCCGMAGAFGFEVGDHYDVSIQCGERALLPSVRQADPETLIVTDGYSCREQIAQTTDRRALHLAQVLQMALAGSGVPREYPERLYSPNGHKSPEESGTPLRTAVLVSGGALLAGGALLWALKKKRGNS